MIWKFRTVLGDMELMVKYDYMENVTRECGCFLYNNVMVKPKLRKKKKLRRTLMFELVPTFGRQASAHSRDNLLCSVSDPRRGHHHDGSSEARLPLTLEM